MEGQPSVLGKRKADGMETDRVESGKQSHVDLITPASEGSSLATTRGNEEEDTNTSYSTDGDQDEDDHSQNSSQDLENDLYNYDDDFEDFEEDYAAPQEREVEEQQHVLNMSSNGPIKIKLFLQEDDDTFEKWMQTIHVHCSHGGKIIGRGVGRYVNRDWIRPNFWQDMEEPCQELSTVAFELFDRYGRLKKEFIDHIVRKGTGCWGSELDLGSLFIIEELHVDRSWRHKSIGSMMIQSLIKKANTGGRDPTFTLVQPGWLNYDIKEDIEGKSDREQQEVRFHAYEVAVSFYRSNGFRRIGASSCFGLATDPNHRAHKIPSDADFDPRDAEIDEDENDVVKEDVATTILDDPWGDLADKSERRLKLLQKRFPLHHATITLADVECAKFYKAFNKPENTEQWGKIDRFHKNVLHLAACEMKAESVLWLLSNVDENKILSSARDVNGRTPMEELQVSLETKRTIVERGMMTVCVSDQFCGFSSEAINSLVVLHGKESLSHVQVQRIKYGCTCGECIEGFLSPRMRFALLCQAEILYDMISEDTDDAEMWCIANENMINNVAPDIQRNFLTNRSLRQGFGHVFDHTATALRANKTPTIHNVLETWRHSSEWPPVTRNFYERGGSPENALRVIFEYARDQDEWAGDGDVHGDAFKDQIVALPECRNDEEFGFVALACGLQNL